MGVAAQDAHGIDDVNRVFCADSLVPLRRRHDGLEPRGAVGVPPDVIDLLAKARSQRRADRLERARIFVDVTHIDDELHHAIVLDVEVPGAHALLVAIGELALDGDAEEVDREAKVALGQVEDRGLEAEEKRLGRGDQIVERDMHARVPAGHAAPAPEHLDVPARGLERGLEWNAQLVHWHLDGGQPTKTPERRQTSLRYPRIIQVERHSIPPPERDKT